jgi:hypothetical protein
MYSRFVSCHCSTVQYCSKCTDILSSSAYEEVSIAWSAGINLRLCGYSVVVKRNANLRICTDLNG